MIINQEKRFAFIHIPKCGGTSVRNQLGAFDDHQGYFGTRREIEGLGLVDAMHLPLAVIASRFPEVAQTLRNATTYALIRDPYARFRSSMSMYLRSVRRAEIDGFDDAGLAAVVDGCIARVSRDDPSLDVEIAHFVRQVDMIQHPDVPLDLRLYATANIPAMLRAMGQHLGHPLREDAHDNQTVTIRYGWLRPYYRSAAQFLNGVLPAQTYAALKRRAVPLLSKPPTRADRGVFNSDTVRDFVSDFYAADLALAERVSHSPVVSLEGTC